MTTTLIGRVESWADSLLGSRTARFLGLLVGLGALAFLVRSFAQAGEAAPAWLEDVTAGRIAVALAGFAAYHLASVLTLRPIFGGPALPIWGAAQLVKYLPVPGSAVLGIVGSTVRRGGTTRHGLAVTVRHALLQVGGAGAVGSLALAARVEDWLGIPSALTFVVGLAACLAVGYLAVRQLGRRLASALIVLTAASWLLLGLTLWHGVALGAGAALQVTAGFAAAWTVGQLALPVPAGLGVREAALLLLLGPELGEVGALTFALGTRVVHVGSDALLALALFTRGGWQSLRGGASSDAG
jgi:hypothetical protein